MRTLILAAITCTSAFTVLNSNFISLRSVYVQTKANYKVDIKKSSTYSGKELEAVYTITCTNTANTKNIRRFELIKSDGRLKNYFMAEFVLVEKTNPAEIKYYPLGWESTKIKVEDLKSDCLSILSNDVAPVDINN